MGNKLVTPLVTARWAHDQTCSNHAALPILPARHCAERTRPFVTFSATRRYGQAGNRQGLRRAPQSAAAWRDNTRQPGVRIRNNHSAEIVSMLAPRRCSYISDYKNQTAPAHSAAMGQIRPKALAIRVGLSPGFCGLSGTAAPPASAAA